MNQEEAQTRMKELEQQIAELPVGSITRKTVNGKIYFISAGLRMENVEKSIFLWMRLTHSENRVSIERRLNRKSKRCVEVCQR